MKKIIYSLIIFIGLVSCDSELDINKNPDNQTQENAALSSQTSAGQIGITAAQSTYYALVGGIWSQYWSQSLAASQYRSIDDYTVNTTSGINTGGWAAMYDALSDVRNAKKIALNSENWNYYLISTCMEVYASQILTDFYGDIPYTEANLGVEAFNPVSDTQEDIYDTMIEALNDALSRNLSESSSPAPAKDDFIFSGDMDKWKIFANTLKLKIFLRQTEVRPSVAQAGIMAMITAGDEFLTEDAGVGLLGDVFKDEANLSNPLYETDRRQLNTATNLRASTTLWSYLNDNSDPRLQSYYGLGNPLDQGDYNSSAAPNSVAVADINPFSSCLFH